MMILVSQGANLVNFCAVSFTNFTQNINKPPSGESVIIKPYSLHPSIHDNVFAIYDTYDDELRN